MSKKNRGRLWIVGVLCFWGLLGSDLSWGYFRLPRQMPPVSPITELWVMPLRWKDVTRYHYGPQEFFQSQVWPEQSPVCIFVGSHQGELSCLDVRYGFKRWSVSLGEPLVGNVALYQGYGYVMSELGTLSKIGLSSGNVFWKESLKVGVTSDMWVDDRGAYFLTTASELWRYDLEKHEKIWRYEDEVFQKLTAFGGSRPTRSQDGKLILVGVPNGGIVAIEDQTGRRAWEHLLDVKHPVDDVDATPILLPDGTLLVSSVQSETQLISSKDGKALHAWPFGSPRGGVSWMDSDSKHRFYLLPSLDAIRLINLNNRQVVSTQKIPLDWGYPLRPVLLGQPAASTPQRPESQARNPAASKETTPVLVVITYSHGPAIVFNTETFQWITVREVMTGFSAPAILAASAGDEVVLYSNFGNVWKFYLNLPQIIKETSVATE